MQEEDKYTSLKNIVKIYLPEDVSVEAIKPESNFISELNIDKKLADK